MIIATSSKTALMIERSREREIIAIRSLETSSFETEGTVQYIFDIQSLLGG
jgi:hypothetical protein